MLYSWILVFSEIGECLLSTGYSMPLAPFTFCIVVFMCLVHFEWRIQHDAEVFDFVSPVDMLIFDADLLKVFCLPFSYGGFSLA